MKTPNDATPSINELAKKIVGMRDPIKGVVFDQPAELGYTCPYCKNTPSDGENFDERLHWGEYNGFLWCSVCNKDYPSAICQPDPDKAIETYLDCVNDAKKLIAFPKVFFPSKEELRDKTLKYITTSTTPHSPYLDYHRGMFDLLQEIQSQLSMENKPESNPTQPYNDSIAVTLLEKFVNLIDRMDRADYNPKITPDMYADDLIKLRQEYEDFKKSNTN